MPIGCSDDGSLHWTDYPADAVDPADPAAAKKLIQKSCQNQPKCLPNRFKNRCKIDENVPQIGL